MSQSAPLLFVVMGPTASGKSYFAEILADHLDAALINADAFQVYRHMDVGTAKPTRKADYSLLDLKDPNEDFGVGEWLRLAESTLLELFQQQRSAVIVGGTGFYIRALTEGYSDLAPAPSAETRQAVQERLTLHGLEALVEELRELSPDTAATIDLKNPIRVTRALEKLIAPSDPIQVRLPEFNLRKLAIIPTKDDSNARIQQRTVQMMQNGWVEEVEQLKKLGFLDTDPGFRAIGYREIWTHLKGDLSFQACQDQIVRNTVQYAKRQRTWLKKEPRLIQFSETPTLTEALRCAGP